MTAFECPSTHGGSGWAIGSYLDGENVVCGICGLRTPAAGLAVPEWVVRSSSRRRIVELQSGDRGMTPTETVVDELHAADIAWPAATAGRTTVAAAVFYDAAHDCPWWARLPLIGRFHRCPIWVGVDFGAPT